MRTAIIACTLVALCGCQILPGSGPDMLAAEQRNTTEFPYDVIDLTPTSVAPYAPTTSVDKPSVNSKSTAGSHVSLAPGDVLKVRIFEPYEGGTFPTLQHAGADLGVQRITENGTITVPGAGTVDVAGLDLEGIQQKIAQQIAGKARSPEVIVELAIDRTNTVVVSGEVKRPGRYSLLDGIKTIIDAINAAGGPAVTTDTPSSQLEVSLRRGGVPLLRLRYPSLLAGDDISLAKGDEIVVRPDAAFFTALGAVVKSGNVPITQPGMTLLDALGAVGGLSDDRANKTGVFVFRLNASDDDPGAGRSKIFQLNLLKPVSIFVAQRFGIRARDVVYVTNAPVYEYNKLLTVLGRTLSVYGTVTGSTTTTTSF